MNKEYVTASELGQYIYCECCWMDSLEGKRIETEAMTLGTSGHEQSFNLFTTMKVVQRVAIVLFLISLLVLSISLVFQLNLW
jgi:hypothetical protein